jgi:hypothetical protein
MTDEDERPVPVRTAVQVHQRLVAAKGDARRLMFLGIGALADCDGVYGRAGQAVLLKEITALFAAQSRGLFWNLCTGALDEGLAKAVRMIRSTCEQALP